MSRGFNVEAAEKEANKVAFQFQNSNDVMSDMSRAYHADFSDIQIHTDDAAAAKVKLAGKDALASGKDVFFGKGIFESRDSASKGLVAHELAHTMQQGMAGEGAQSAMNESAPAGAEQGGVIDWFKKKFGKKKEPEMQISDPVLVKDSPTSMNHQSEAMLRLVQDLTPKQLQNEQVQQMVMDSFNTNMNARLKEKNGTDKFQMSSNFRGKETELTMLNSMLEKLMPTNLHEQVYNSMESGGGSDAGMDVVRNYVEQDPTMMRLLPEMGKAFNGVDFFGNDEGEQSQLIMNNLILRQIGKSMIKEQNDAYNKEYSRQKKNNKNPTADLNAITRNKIAGTRGAKMLQHAHTLMKDTSNMNNKSDSANAFRRFLVGKLHH